MKKRGLLAIVALAAFLAFAFLFSGVITANEADLPRMLYDNDGNLIGMRADQARKQMSPDTLQAYANPVVPVYTGQQNFEVYSGGEDPIPMLDPFDPDILVYSSPNTDDTPRIAFNDADGVLWIVFTHNNGADDDVFLCNSTDVGQTWNPVLWTTGAYNERNPAIAIMGNTIMIAYEQDNAGWEQRTYFIRSQDGGLNWGGFYMNWDWTNDPSRLQLEDFNYPDLSISQVDWFHWTADAFGVRNNTRTVAFMWTEDDGDSWWMVYWTATWHMGEDFERAVIMENLADNYMHMAYQHYNNTEAGWDIEWLIVDHGLSDVWGWWTANLDGGNSEVQPDIWVREDICYVVWQNGTAVEPDLAAFYSDDGGASSLWILWIKSTDGFAQMYPAVYLDDTYMVHIAVVNDTSVMHMSNDDPLGAAFNETKADDAPGTAVADFRATDILYALNNPRLTWADARSGPADIYYTDLGEPPEIPYTITRFPLIAEGDIIITNVTGTFFCSGTCIYNWTLGTTHTLEAPTYMYLTGDPNTRYIFSGWSDLGAQNHTITVGPSPMTITAIYDTQYNISFKTAPDTGLDLVIDMVTYTAPQDFWYTEGTLVSIDAVSPQTITGTSRWVWQSWSDGGGKSHQTTIAGVTTYTATFEIQYMVNVTTNPTALDVEVDGFIYSNPVNPFWWLDGSTHVLNATSPQYVNPDERWAFDSWSDGGAIEHTITVTGPETYTANYITQYNITFTTSPPGLNVEVDGTVWPTSKNFFFDVGSTHTINAPSPQPINPTSQYIWSSWNDGGAQSHDILISGPGTYTANFEVQYRMDVTTSPLGLNITVNGVEHQSPHFFWCTNGDTAQLGAPSPQPGSTPDQRYRYDRWSDGGMQTHPILCSSPGSYTAFFIAQYQVNVTTDPEGLKIEVGGIEYDAPRLEWVDTGGSLLINARSPQATGDTRAVFDHWSDGQPQSHTITVTSPGIYIAYFDTEFLMTITSTPDAGLDVDVDGVTQTTPHQFWCNDGDSVTLYTPSPQDLVAGQSRYEWRSWSDGGLQSHTITCDAPDTITANFALQYRVTITTNPGALQIEVDGVTRTATYATWWDDDSVHTLNAPSPQDLVPGQSRHEWRSWSPAGTQSHSITVTDSATHMATFKLQYKVTITSDPVGRDVIVEGSTYTAPYEIWWDESTNLGVDVPSPQTIVAGQERYIFNSWSDSGAKSHSIFVALSATYTAYMDHQYYLTVTSAYGDPQGEGWYDEDAVAPFSVTTPYPPGATDTRYAFAAWTGDSTAMTPSATITMDGPKTVTASWTTQYMITITTSPAGLDVIVDTVTQTAPYTAWWNENSQPTVNVASTQAGGTGVQYIFASWSDSGAQSHTITVTQPATYTASFTTQYYLTVTSTHGDPQCDITTCWYNEDAVATFSVTTPYPPGATTTRYVFAAWTGDSTSSSASATVTMNGPKTVTATWTTQYHLTVNSERGDPTGSGWYDAGSSATFSVTTPVDDYEFSGWTGDSTASSSTATITMNAPKTVTATWEQVGFLEKFWWIFPIIIIIIIIVIVALLMMKRRKPGEEELPPPEEMEIPPEEEV